MAPRNRRLAIGAAVAALLAIVIYVRLGRFEGGLVDVPAEAVPIWASSELTFLNKIVEYIIPVIVPLGSMINCPLVPPHDTECMTKARNAVASAGEAQWASLIESTHVETVIQIDGMEVVLLVPRNMSRSISDAPLILWFHGGAFTVGIARETYLISYLNAFLEDTMPVAAKDAVWASVEYRLAPEHPYPAAPDDGFRALEYLLLEHTVDGDSTERHLGGGGVHIGGPSAGATLATTTAMRALKAGLRIDSVLVDEPMFLSPSNTDVDSAMPPFLDSNSHRRNVYSRVTPILWLEWCVYAYVGRQDTNITDFDLTGGVMSASEWKKSAEQQQLPPIVLVTAKGDMLHDGGVEFGRVYEEAGGSVHHVVVSASHALAFMFDLDAAQGITKSWARLIQEAADRK